jgi:TPR repeat protein
VTALALAGCASAPPRLACGTQPAPSCAAGDAEASDRIERARMLAEGGAAEVARAKELLACECDVGSVEGCVDLAILRKAHGRPRDAFENFFSACDRGSTRGCMLLATFQPLTSDDRQRVARLLTARVASGAEGTCEDLVRLLDDGSLATPPPADVASAVDTCCVARISAACDALEPRARQSDPSGLAALRSLRTACEASSPRACAIESSIVLADPAIDREPSHVTDPERVTELLDRACSGGSASTCERLGRWLFGRFPRDLDRSLRAYARGCELGDPTSCREAGPRASYVSGEWAFRLYTRGCEIGEPYSCLSEGIALRSGHGTARDVAHAARIFRDLCARGAPSACTMLRELRSGR